MSNKNKNQNKPDNEEKNPEDELQEEEGGVATMSIVEPFEIEADHPRNCDLLVQCIPGVRLRSALDGGKPIIDAKTGEKMIPRDQAASLSGLQLPGMRIRVDPERLSYRITDPIRDNEEELSKLERHFKRKGGARIQGRWNGEKTQKGKLDVHRMKSLIRELRSMVVNGHAKVVKGNVPSTEAIEEMPGEFLLNPGARTNWNQPTFEKDWNDWYENLMRAGG